MTVIITHSVYFFFIIIIILDVGHALLVKDLLIDLQLPRLAVACIHHEPAALSRTFIHLVAERPTLPL